MNLRTIAKAGIVLGGGSAAATLAVKGTSGEPNSSRRDQLAIGSMGVAAAGVGALGAFRGQHNIGTVLAFDFLAAATSAMGIGLTAAAVSDALATRSSNA